MPRPARRHITGSAECSGSGIIEFSAIQSAKISFATGQQQIAVSREGSGGVSWVNHGPCRVECSPVRLIYLCRLDLVKQIYVVRQQDIWWAKILAGPARRIGHSDAKRDRSRIK